MKLNKTVFVAVNNDGELAETAEGLVMSDDRSDVYFMLKAWRISRSEFRVKKAKVVLLDEE